MRKVQIIDSFYKRIVSIFWSWLEPVSPALNAITEIFSKPFSKREADQGGRSRLGGRYFVLKYSRSCAHIFKASGSSA